MPDFDYIPLTNLQSRFESKVPPEARLATGYQHTIRDTLREDTMKLTDAERAE